jgi:hypothetical protein
MKIAVSVSVLLLVAVEARAQVALEDAQLRPVGAPLGGYYGEALAIHDNVAIVGEPGDDSIAPNAGVARVFRRAPNGAWNETQLLVPSLHGTGHEFGHAVAFDGATVAISAPGNERVFVFNDLGSGMFTEIDVLVNPEPTTVGFGSTLDVELGLLATTSEFSAFGSSTPPSLHVFERNVATWNLSQSVPLTDASGALFTPASLSLTLDAGLLRIAIGTREKLSLPSFVPTSHVHVYEATTSFNWSRTATIGVPAPFVGGAFGYDVAVHRTRLAVSRHAPAEAGRVFTFERASASSWTLTDEVLPPNSAIGDWFGIALDLEQDRLLVGAPGLPTGLPGGGAWLFERRVNGTWSPSVEFRSSSDVQLGLTCDLSGPFGAARRAAVGSGNVATSAGAVQVYDLGTLYHGTNAISLAAGGTRELFMRAGEARGGDAYVLLASLSGSQPGTLDPVTGFTIPINVDAYTLFLLQNGGGSILFPWIGVLDADGRADATYAVAPGTSLSFVGVQVHHTFVAVDPLTLGLTQIGNAVRVRLQP